MIKVEKIGFARGKKVILHNFSMQLATGEIVLVSGENGSGKTTLLQLIGGVLTPSSGTITLGGKKLGELSVHEQARIRAIAPARRSFTLAFTVQELLEVLPKNERVSNMDEIVASLGLTDLLERKVTELSTGQQERVSVAIALCQEADFYLLDEPFSAQDQANTQKMIQYLLALKSKKGILVISHNQDALRSYFDREITLSEPLQL
jgi:ABC-type Mn2+/Zn2+ transport system ATPase subunit